MAPPSQPATGRAAPACVTGTPPGSSGAPADHPIDGAAAASSSATIIAFTGVGTPCRAPARTMAPLRAQSSRGRLQGQGVHRTGAAHGQLAPGRGEEIGRGGGADGGVAEEGGKRSPLRAVGHDDRAGAWLPHAAGRHALDRHVDHRRDDAPGRDEGGEAGDVLDAVLQHGHEGGRSDQARQPGGGAGRVVGLRRDEHPVHRGGSIRVGQRAA